MSDAPKTVLDRLKNTPALAEAAGFAEAAAKVFDYAQFLLDKDENLTRSGALDGSARELLRARILELVGDVSPQPDGRAKRREIFAQAQALSLQSTIISDVPMAIINGCVVRLGERTASGFEVIEISACACTVMKDGVKVTLEIIGQRR